MFTDDADFFPSIMVTCVVKKDRLKDCFSQKRDMLCGAPLLVRVGSPMIVLQTCTPSLNDI